MKNSSLTNGFENLKESVLTCFDARQFEKKLLGIAVTAGCLLSSLPVSAQCETVSDSVIINFRKSEMVVDRDFKQNDNALSVICNRLSDFTNPDSAMVLKRIYVAGSASPEGSTELNRRLSEERAKSIFNYLSQLYSFPDSLTTFNFIGRDWDRLLLLVESDKAVPYRDEALEVIRKIICDRDNGRREDISPLKRLKRGVTYRYLHDNIFPCLRESKLVVSYERPQREKVENVKKDEMNVVVENRVVELPVEDTLIVEEKDTLIVEERRCRPFYMDFHTNMLYDIAAVPNIGIEFYMGRNLSASLNWMYAWWSNDEKHRYWRVYGGDLTVRYWFGQASHEKPLTGHHVGIYGQVLTYDFEFGGKGYMGGLPHGTLLDRCNYGGGVEYGYSLPIARRLNIDFTIGLGYLGGEYREYRPVNDKYIWLTTKKHNWFGPTKAEVSLVWLIGCDNFNRRKHSPAVVSRPDYLIGEGGER